jgi:small subunit ribosomal protein S7
MENIAAGGHGSDPVAVGHKYGLPELPIPANANLHYRYDPVVSQVTNLLMRDGKLSVAQRVGSSVFSAFTLHAMLRRRRFEIISLTLIVTIEHVIHFKPSTNRSASNT